MRILALTLCAGFLLCACGGPKPDTDQGADADSVSRPRLSPDSLARLYAAYRAEQADPMPAEAPVERGKLYPVDEAPLDTSFFVYRQQLLQAVERRDVFALLDAVAEDIQTDAAQDNGAAGLVELYQLDASNTDTLPIWAILERVLREGGTFGPDGSTFTAPYYFANWPSHKPPAAHVAITGSGVRIRSVPGLNGEIVKTVSYPIAKLITYEESKTEIGGEWHPWVQIELEGGVKGFVYGKFVGAPSGYHLRFAEKQPGYWVMTHLLNGD